MEILLIACMLAYAAGAQSEQSKLGLSPAQRASMREQTRHEKAVQRIAEKHGGTAPAAGGAEVATPETFWSGYRNRRSAEHPRTPISHRAGTWTAQGVTWAQDTGRGAWQAYRKRRRDAGHEDPGPVFIPLPRDQSPLVPPMPSTPPTVGFDSDKSAGPAAAEESPKKGDEESAKEPAVDLKKAPGKTPVTPDEPAVDTAPEPDQDDTTPSPTPQSADKPQGVGRMAADVTYESVMEESDELSLMCEDDVRVYGRIHARAEREIARGDDLIVALQSAGFGAGVIGWVTRCMDQYRAIRAQLGDLEVNTIAQGEKVVAAKSLLEAGQGVYAEIAKDMESVAERDSYISDAVDAEDTSAHTEIYETKAA
ncbi:hypothetical protein ACFVZR_07640 [Streptomyces sp. NPDC058316]|uniref:hypothetical protein n=1 Tax=Streptomyces sp. NPDC058316 TaxID=3346442 RepID=UPI0036E400B4